VASDREQPKTTREGGSAWSPPLSRLEESVVAHAGRGEALDLFVEETPDAGRTHVRFAVMGKWGADRTVRAEVLRHLLVESQWPVHAKGVRLRGARIEGVLDLESATLRCPLVLRDCYLDSGQPVSLDYATASRLEMVRCRLAGLAADTLVATMGLDLSGSTFTGPVRLVGANVTGQLSLRGAEITATDKDQNALVADRITVDGGAFLDGGFTAAGTVRLHGAIVIGQLSLRGATITPADKEHNALVADGITVRGDALLDDGFIAYGTVCLPGASITGPLSLEGARITPTGKDHRALVADGITVGGGAFFGDGFTAGGTVSLIGANITVQLGLKGARITAVDKDGDALVADRIAVDGDAFLDDGFTADGTVRLPGASITGELGLRGARITAVDKDGDALVADRITVGGGVFLDGGFAASGAVCLPGASITGELSLRGARIAAADKGGDALVADRITVDGGVFLDGGFTAGGAVRLFGASITGQLSLTGAQITPADRNHNALVADGITVGGGVFLDGGFTAGGAVCLRGASITGPLSLSRATLAGTTVALDARGAKISQQLVWAPNEPVKGAVNLERAQVQRLDDSWSKVRGNGYWPTGGGLRLAGFAYEGFGGSNPATREQRLEWIRGQHQKPHGDAPGRFDAQPYEQLARVYRQVGQETDARGVAVARRNDLRTYGDLGWWQRLGNWLLDVTIKHGHQPLRALRILLLVYALAFVLFVVAQHQDDVMVPIGDTSSLEPVPTAMVGVEGYPDFHPWAYAVDVTIPIVKTGQADHWEPDTEAEWGWAWYAGSWVFTGLGWALAVLAVAGCTGLVRKD
jgi:hypothetical protein